ncbi:winged helix-turn-helix transcriptional regulator [Portibacter lacus]|uniref:HTH hxlR-type domain-containing protein n=1 Tax=Portibacter lacus TaxID=1099794 RepID=A0AA37SW07_9BACT|nr:helix-turn-helix domain-containing protein [Portibacter lacus]GLR19053.1 hypothetical protein GCM10007940_36690 [Portibacter lacus]
MQFYKKSETNRLNCPIQLTNQILGDKWVLLILRELFLGNTKFDEFEKNLAISKSVLTVKLNLLVQHGLIIKTDYKEEKKRTRSEYQLSKKGSELIFMMGAILDWGNTNLVSKEETYLKIIDKTGAPVKLVFVNQNNKILSLNDLSFELS